jgi:hypothetical protein
MAWIDRACHKTVSGTRTEVRGRIKAAAKTRQNIFEAWRMDVKWARLPRSSTLQLRKALRGL